MDSAEIISPFTAFANEIERLDVNGKISKSITDTHNKITEGEEVGFDIDYNSIYIFKENGVRVY